jgi:hypothetical protein
VFHSPHSLQKEDLYPPRSLARKRRYLMPHRLFHSTLSLRLSTTRYLTSKHRQHLRKPKYHQLRTKRHLGTLSEQIEDTTLNMNKIVHLLCLSHLPPLIREVPKKHRVLQMETWSVPREEGLRSSNKPPKQLTMKSHRFQ